MFSERDDAPPPPGSAPRLDARTVVRISGLFILSRLLVVTVASLARLAIRPGLNATTDPSLIQRFFVWDSLWYMRIVEGGYDYNPTGESRVGFYPLYPMLIRATTFLGLDGRIGGYLISLVTLYVSCFLLWKLAVRETRSERVGWLSVLFLLFCPASMWFGMVYTESLYLLTVVGCLLCARNRQWLQAGLWGCASALTRTPGLLLAGFLFLEAAQQWWEQRRALAMGETPRASRPAADLGETGGLPGWARVWRWPWQVRAALSVAGPVLGHVSYLVFLQVQFGDWRAQQKTMAAGWKGHMQMPWAAIREQWDTVDPLFVSISMPLLALVLALAVVGLFTLKRIGYAALVWALAFLYVCATPGEGVTRYLCTSVPVFIVLAQLAERSPLLETTVLVFSTAIMALLTALLANGYHII